ncbi:MAG: metallophosphoesterase [Hyphomicrobiales bacterium]|nr:metallophosphoesterase [Hyphomicrobiales bacterium]
MLDRTWLLFGGPYGNLQAMEALLTEARSLGIPAERMLCTGDLVAYCGDPVETIDLIRDAGIPVVMGNCDEQLAAGANDCGCGFDPESSCARLSADWYAYSNSVVRADQREWLATLPKRIDLEIGGRSLAAIHGSARAINEFIFAGTPGSTKQDSLDALGCDGVVGGHCGLPFTEQVGNRLWHNPGVIGMPANDGTARVWFSLVTPTENGVWIDHRALGYDHEAAQAAMRRAGLPPCYREALVTGLWPSLDVLPQGERAMTGFAIPQTRFAWPADKTSPLFNAA